MPEHHLKFKYVLRTQTFVVFSFLDLEGLGDDYIALGPHLEVKTCDRFRLKTIIRLYLWIFGSKAAFPLKYESSLYLKA